MDRTNFIDAQLQAFLERERAAVNSSPRAQVVALGAGYDTRSLRFQREGLQFFEVHGFL